MKLKAEDAIVAWVPNRDMYSGYRERGNVGIFTQTSQTRDFSHTTGRDTAGWEAVGIEGRRQRVQAAVIQMLHVDGIELKVIRSALCEVDEWTAFPFSTDPSGESSQ
jgi:hypothetical protein